MYTEYEQKMERLARILKKVKKITIIVVIVVSVFLAFFFLVGFRYRALKCNSVVYGEKPDPSSGFSAIGETTYEFRPAGAEDAEWSTEVPLLVGEYEVRAHSVSVVGIKNDSGIKKFQILPKELDIRLTDLSTLGEVYTVTVSEDDYEIGGLEYDDYLKSVKVQTEEKGSDLIYYLDEFVILHSDGTDASDCYRIPKKTASIRDAHERITVAAGSRTMTYDGDIESFRNYDEWTIVSGALKPGHTAEFHCKSYPDAAKGDLFAVNRIVDGVIRDEDGNEVTDQYYIDYKDGELKLLPRQITLTSGSATKKYDGVALTNPNFTVSGAGVAEGDTLSTRCTGSIVNPGTVPNDLDTIKVTNDEHGDVTRYYDIATVLGKLKVTANISGGGNGSGGSGGSGSGGSGGGNGSGGSGQGLISTASEDGFQISRDGSEFSGSMGDFRFGGQQNNAQKVFSFYAQSNRDYYFKEFSYGVYNGSGFQKSEGEEDYKPWCDYLVGNAILSNGTGYRDVVRIADLAIDHPVYPYFMSGGAMAGGETGRYTCETYFYSYGQSIPTSNDSREAEYKCFVYSNYLDVPEDVKQELLRLGENAGLSNSDSLIEDIADYIQNAAEYSFDFGTFPEDEDMVLYFLKKSKKGICQHYAAAATLMYRAYGIPARFVLGFMQQGRPGRWTTVSTNRGHAWVEVYIEGSGWIPVEVTGQPGYSGGMSGGMLGGGEYQEEDDDEYLEVSVMYEDFVKVYDGQRAGSKVLNGYLRYGRLRDGDKITIQPVMVEDNEVYRNVGVYDFEIPMEAIRITDSAGRDVTDLYVVGYTSPAYSVLPRPLSIAVYGDFDKETTGTGMHRMQWSISDGSLAPGHTLEVYRDDSESDYDLVYSLGVVGNHTIRARILDENGRNVTDNYDLTTSQYYSSDVYR